jgi:hypothetical protein
MWYPAIPWEDFPTLGARTSLSAKSSTEANAGGDARAPRNWYGKIATPPHPQRFPLHSRRAAAVVCFRLM